MGELKQPDHYTRGVSCDCNNMGSLCRELYNQTTLAIRGLICISTMPYDCFWIKTYPEFAPPTEYPTGGRQR